MNTTATEVPLTELHATLTKVTAAAGEPIDLTGEELRTLATGGTAILTYLARIPLLHHRSTPRSGTSHCGPGIRG
ncbi:hypothetical protein [Glutamicibacter arilaitensis]|uniref:hypothetical protein n=1 Tax=Glutamicibacter arilaitensis TaxID=256701 RepID=UPI00384B987E